MIGSAMAIGGAISWYSEEAQGILATLLIGVGASIIAAAVVAYLSPFSEAAYRRFISLGIDQVWTSRKAVPDREWVDWLNRAKSTCTLLGIAHGNWCNDGRFKNALTDRLEHGVKIKTLFLNPNSAAAELRSKEEGTKRDTREAIRKSIQFIWNFRESLQPALKERLRIYVYDATPSCGLTWIDDFMIVTHYLAGSPNVTSPALLVKPAQVGMSGGLYDIYVGNVNAIALHLSIELEDKNIHPFMPSAG